MCALWCLAFCWTHLKCWLNFLQGTICRAMPNKLQFHWSVSFKFVTEFLQQASIQQAYLAVLMTTRALSTISKGCNRCVCLDHETGNDYCKSYGEYEFANVSQNCSYPVPSALVMLSSQLLEGVEFSVSKVCYNLNTSTGYFGVYWYCCTSQQKFTVHCTLAKWNVQIWTETSITG